MPQTSDSWQRWKLHCVTELITHASVVQDQLNSMTKEFTSTAASAQRTLRGLFGGKAATSAPVPEGVPTTKLRPGYGTTSNEGTAQERAARGIMKRVTLAEFGSAAETTAPQKAQLVIKEPGKQLLPCQPFSFASAASNVGTQTVDTLLDLNILAVVQRCNSTAFC